MQCSCGIFKEVGPVEDSWMVMCKCKILLKENCGNWTRGGQLEVGLPLWNSLEKIWKAGPVEDSWNLLCCCGILWRECGKLCQW